MEASIMAADAAGENLPSLSGSWVKGLDPEPAERRSPHCATEVGAEWIEWTRVEPKSHGVGGWVRFARYIAPERAKDP